MHVLAKVKAGEDSLKSRKYNEINELAEMLKELFGSVMTVTDVALQKKVESKYRIHLFLLFGRFRSRRPA